MDFLISQDLLNLIVVWLQILGAPIAVSVFVYGKFREIRDREAGTYAALSDKYEAYLQTCLAHSDLPVFDAADSGGTELTTEQNKRMQIVFCLLISMHEQAFLLYRGTRSAVRKRQWAGWEEYLDQWLSNVHLAELWPCIRSQFDADFVAFAELLIARKQPRMLPLGSPQSEPGGAMSVAED
ncbi:MAG: hypothetical protein R3F18_13790 [Lysobacterales bacterium]|nr:hypothetical protein [Xanthomonadales bacterium]